MAGTRAKTEWPDLRRQLRRQPLCVPPHDEGQTAELDQIATEQEHRLERLLALSRASGEEHYDQGDHTECRHDEVDHVEPGGVSSYTRRRDSSAMRGHAKLAKEVAAHAPRGPKLATERDEADADLSYERDVDLERRQL